MNILENVNGISVKRRWLRKAIICFLSAPILQTFFESLAIRTSIKLKQEANRCNSIDEYVNLAFNFQSNFLLSIAPFQVKKEITELLEILSKNRPIYVLEIGTSRGGTLFLLTRISSPNAVIISVDLPQGEFGGLFYPNWKAYLYRSFAICRQKMHLIRGDSHAASTAGMIEKILNGHGLDFLLIDGDHTYEGIKLDLQVYGPLVHKGGVIAFHDICSGPPELVGGVNRFWNEIKYGYKYQELFASSEQKGFGIGVLFA